MPPRRCGSSPLLLGKFHILAVTNLVEPLVPMLSTLIVAIQTVSYTESNNASSEFLGPTRLQMVTGGIQVFQNELDESVKNLARN
jgi:hypothetical protein